MALYEALYSRRCRTPSCWTELGEWCVLGPELVYDTKDKVRLIRDRLKMTLDRQKSYVDLKRKEIEYSMGDFVFLKVLLWKKRYYSNPMYVISIEEIEAKLDLTFEEEPVQILDHDVKVLRRKSIPLVKDEHEDFTDDVSFRHEDPPHHSPQSHHTTTPAATLVDLSKRFTHVTV
ncbi:uncharacterized protein [Gossypium hirsutum]|uniref:Reverse transcriptase domain-containing protein n=1 Tax=Gossypium hirsutum TaxID=3635 RepID=A0A1U8HVB3_GOSHI|nr:uncharacterized protein LOC107889940 [Gossypium hirsutum]